jgi:phosphoserine phosphatase
MNLRMIYESDPGHGWLRVHLERIIELGVRVSAYSYAAPRSYDDGVVWLEEDCDMSAFLRAAQVAGWHVEIVERSTNQDSPIRNMQRAIDVYPDLKECGV